MDIKTKSDTISYCEKMRSEGFSCAESVFRSLIYRYDLSVSEQLLKGISAFAGGAAQDGRCGALEASLAVLSILYENKTMNTLISLNEYSVTLHKMFSDSHGSILCKDIFYPLYDAHMKRYSDEAEFKCAFFSGLDVAICFFDRYVCMR